MIDILRLECLDEVMAIWLAANVAAHNFIPEDYWLMMYDAVRKMITSAEIFAHSEGGIVRGFVGITDASCVAGLFVAPECQGRGIGSGLVRHCQKIYSRLELRVYQKNTRAVKFYESLGFNLTAMGMDETTGESEYVMTWTRKKS